MADTIDIRAIVREEIAGWARRGALERIPMNKMPADLDEHIIKVVRALEENGNG